MGYSSPSDQWAFVFPGPRQLEILELISRDGACRDADAEVFFPEKGQSAAPAKIICRACPGLVRGACLDYAVRNEETEGVWGGKTARERKSIRRRRQRPFEE